MGIIVTDSEGSNSAAVPMGDCLRIVRPILSAMSLANRPVTMR